jgi:hypothetical protein
LDQTLVAGRPVDVHDLEGLTHRFCEVYDELDTHPLLDRVMPTNVSPRGYDLGILGGELYDHPGPVERGSKPAAVISSVGLAGSE